MQPLDRLLGGEGLGARQAVEPGALGEDRGVGGAGADGVGGDAGAAQLGGEAADRARSRRPWRRSRRRASAARAWRRPRRPRRSGRDAGPGRRSRAGTPTRAAARTASRSTSSTARSCRRGISHSGTPPAITPAAAMTRRARRWRSAVAAPRRDRALVGRVGHGAATSDGSGAAARAARRQLELRGCRERYGSRGSSAARSTTTDRVAARRQAAAVAAPMPRAPPVDDRDPPVGHDAGHARTKRREVGDRRRRAARPVRGIGGRSRRRGRRSG